MDKVIRELPRRIRVHWMRHPLIDGSIAIIAAHAAFVAVFAAVAICSQ